MHDSADPACPAPLPVEDGTVHVIIRVSGLIIPKTLGITVGSSYCWQVALQQSLLPLRMNRLKFRNNWI
jgi:hypothetical protein